MKAKDSGLGSPPSIGSLASRSARAPRCDTWGRRRGRRARPPSEPDATRGAETVRGAATRHPGLRRASGSGPGPRALAPWPSRANRGSHHGSSTDSRRPQSSTDSRRPLSSPGTSPGIPRIAIETRRPDPPTAVVERSSHHSRPDPRNKGRRPDACDVFYLPLSPTRASTAPSSPDDNPPPPTSLVAGGGTPSRSREESTAFPVQEARCRRRYQSRLATAAEFFRVLRVNGTTFAQDHRTRDPST